MTIGLLLTEHTRFGVSTFKNYHLFPRGSCRPLIPRVWLGDHHDYYHQDLGRNSNSGPSPDLLNQNLYSNETLYNSQAH